MTYDHAMHLIKNSRLLCGMALCLPALACADGPVSDTDRGAALQGRLSRWDGPVQTRDEHRLRFLVGAAAYSGAGFMGAQGRSWGLKPALALEWGRLRLSSGGGQGLLDPLGHGRSTRGLEGILEQRSRWSLSLSLNLDRGRGELNDDLAHSGPSVPSTLRGRVRLRYQLTQRWHTSLALGQDLLGRGGGLEADAWLGYRLPLGEGTRLTAGLGLSAGNRPFMRSEFGRPEAPGRAAYRPRGGIYQSQLGMELTHSLSSQWVAYGGVRSTWLHGPARHSPLVRRSHDTGLWVGLAWRN